MAPWHWDESPLRLREAYPAPAATDRFAVVDVELAGICRTDLEIMRGYTGFRGILGHELVGVVRACSDREWIGQRVTTEINVGCGVCSFCSAGMTQHCTTRGAVGIHGWDGGFASSVLLPVANLVPVPSHMSNATATFAEPFAAALAVLDQVPLLRTAPAIVLGAGKLGLLVAQALRMEGLEVWIHAKHPNQRRAAEALGLSLIDDLCGVQVPLVVDATGRADVVEQAVGMVEPCGTLVLKSTVADSPSIDFTNIVVNEINLVGSRCGDVRQAVAVLGSEEIDLAPLIERSYSLLDGLMAIEHAGRPGALKIFLDPTREPRRSIV